MSLVFFESPRRSRFPWYVFTSQNGVTLKELTIKPALTGVIEPKVKVSNIPEGMELSDCCATNLLILKGFCKTYFRIYYQYVVFI